MKKHVLLFSMFLCLGNSFSQCMQDKQPDIENAVQTILAINTGLLSDVDYIEKIERELSTCNGIEREEIQRSIVKQIFERHSAFKTYLSRSCDEQFHMTPKDIMCCCNTKSHGNYPKVDIATNMNRCISDMHKLYNCYWFIDNKISLKHTISLYFLYNWRKDRGEPLDVSGFANICEHLSELANLPSHFCPTDFKNFVFKTLIAD